MFRVWVLIETDETIFRLDLRNLLERAGLDVVAEARDGVEAVEIARAERPDVAIMDVKMPRLDGIEAARRIREALPHACILMLTGSNSPLDVDRARQAGAAGYVTKDHIAAELVDTILSIASR